MWRHKSPDPADFDSEEEYQEYLAAYEEAESQYVDDFIDNHFNH